MTHNYRYRWMRSAWLRRPLLVVVLVLEIGMRAYAAAREAISEVRNVW